MIYIQHQLPAITILDTSGYITPPPRLIRHALRVGLYYKLHHTCSSSSASSDAISTFVSGGRQLLGAQRQVRMLCAYAQPLASTYALVSGGRQLLGAQRQVRMLCRMHCV